ncbi:MAG: extracellular solute-binding protein [Firmicutes bacterium]|nr:extracellular solute-binding protein [Bacillota bacterium]
MKKLLAFALALGMLISLLAVPALAADEVAKPEKITIMVDATLVTSTNGRDAFEARWEELTGIDLEIIQPDHDAYYDVMQQQIASGDWPDVLIMSSTYYSSYAAEGVLWDMTEAWDSSATKNSGRFVGDTVFDGLKIGGSLYGFAPTRGNGCLTYIKQAWLDAVGMGAPTTYDEFLAVCDAFVN